MFRALAIKELREVAGIAVVALALNLALVCNLTGFQIFTWIPGMPSGISQVPFAGTAFAPFFSFVCAGLAIALGFRQSLWEANRGTFLFLLHRPVPRSSIFLTKLVTGVATFWAASVLPALLYAWWAATPGHHPSPFEWSMTGPVFAVCLTLPLVYLGAFLSGLRPARWLGTKLLPLAACGLATLLLAVLVPWWAIGLPVTALLSVCLGIAICEVGRSRDY